jgi:hypothetical protein
MCNIRIACFPFPKLTFLFLLIPAADHIANDLSAEVIRYLPSISRSKKRTSWNGLTRLLNITTFWYESKHGLALCTRMRIVLFPSFRDELQVLHAPALNHASHDTPRILQGLLHHAFLIE